MTAKRKTATKKAPPKIQLNEAADAKPVQNPAELAVGGKAIHEGEVVEVTTRQYVGPLGPEYICDVTNIENSDRLGLIWTVMVNGDERRFMSGRPVQLAEAHIEALKHAVIEDLIPINIESGYYHDQKEAEAQNPGMRYVVEKGVPYLSRDKKRYVWSIFGPADSPPLLHGGVKEEIVKSLQERNMI